MNWDLALADAEALLARYESEPAHPRHVATLAAQLFFGLQTTHRRSPTEAGAWLHLAALLHDIGWSQTKSGKGHHKWSAQLILAHSWKGLSEREVAMVAQIARYHRKSVPSLDHEGYAALAISDRKIVSEMGGILRLADALDRKHLQIVQQVEVQVTEEAITLWVNAKDTWDEEREMVRRKKDLLESALGREVLV